MMREVVEIALLILLFVLVVRFGVWPAVNAMAHAMVECIDEWDDD